MAIDIKISAVQALVEYDEVPGRPIDIEESHTAHNLCAGDERHVELNVIPGITQLAAGDERYVEVVAGKTIHNVVMDND
jgi:hypothetical protein